jgi:hypothetical protein
VKWPLKSARSFGEVAELKWLTFTLVLFSALGHDLPSAVPKVSQGSLLSNQRGCQHQLIGLLFPFPLCVEMAEKNRDPLLCLWVVKFRTLD